MMKLKDSFAWTEFWFVLFLIAGAFKGHFLFSWIPLDFTVLILLISIGFTINRLIIRKFKVSIYIYWLLGFFILMAIPTLLAMEFDEYGGEKILRFYGLTLWSAIGPFFIIRDRHDFKRMMQILFILCFIICLVALVNFIASGGRMPRLQSFSATTIMIGRFAGLALLWVVVLLVTGDRRSLWWYLMAGVFLITLLGSGSKGPILIFFIVSGVLLPLLFASSLRFWKRILIVVIPLMIAAPLAYPFLPETSRYRVERFVSGDLKDPSTMPRIASGKASIDLALDYPQGVGIGGFPRHTDIIDRGNQLLYPHNIFLEILVEGGWVGAFIFLAVLIWAFVLAFYRHLSKATSETAILVLGLLFLFFNGFVSGDLNDNKLFFAFLATCFCTKSDAL